MGPTVKPIYDDTMYTKPIEGVTLTEKGVLLNGRKINCNRWSPEGSPKGVVVVSHGLHEHGLRYYSLAAVLAKKGYVVIACDHSSHGLSDGVRGLITDYRVLPMDFVSLCTVAHEEFPTLPCFIVSHSMGTLVSIMAIGDLPFVKAVVFCGCPIFSGPAASSIFGMQSLYFLSQTFAAPYITCVLASLAPTGSAAPILLDEQTSSEEARTVLRKDPRRYEGDIMNKSAYELIKWITAVKDEIPNIKVPFMCLHGEDDIIALPKGSVYLMEHSSTDDSKKSIFLLPDVKHEMFHEKAPYDRDSILQVLDYFESFENK